MYKFIKYVMPVMFALNILMAIFAINISAICGWGLAALYYFSYIHKLYFPDGD